MTRSALSIAAIVIAACGSSGGDNHPDPGNDGHEVLLEPLQGKETQGQDLLGDKLDGLGLEPGYHVNMMTNVVTADGVAVQVTFDGSASLRSGTHRGADPYFNGMVLTGSQGAKFRLTVAKGGYDVALYKIELRTGPEAWLDLCTIDGVPDGDAIPLDGKWQRSGFHEHASDRDIGWSPRAGSFGSIWTTRVSGGGGGGEPTGTAIGWIKQRVVIVLGVPDASDSDWYVS
jgi:hypothetical protein